MTIEHDKVPKAERLRQEMKSFFLAGESDPAVVQLVSDMVRLVHPDTIVDFYQYSQDKKDKFTGKPLWNLFVKYNFWYARKGEKPEIEHFVSHMLLNDLPFADYEVERPEMEGGSVKDMKWEE